jgi:hypothetical protein
MRVQTHTTRAETPSNLSIRFRDPCTHGAAPRTTVAAAQALLISELVQVPKTHVY